MKNTQLSAMLDPEAIAIRERHMARLEAVFAGEHLDRAFVLSGINSFATVAPETDPEAWVAESLASLAEQGELGRHPTVFHPLCLEHLFFGLHFLDAVLGATVLPAEEDTSNLWWTTPLTTPVGTLSPPDLAHNAHWLRAQALARAMVASDATVPFFTTQILDGPLTVAVNLYGEEFLIALAMEPEAAIHDLQVITDTVITLTRWYQATLPAQQLQPGYASGRCQLRGSGQIYGCSTQLLSADTYRDYIAPLDAAVLSCHPRGGMIHLCGAHTQHLTTWRAMPMLRAVQLNDQAADDFPIYFRELRDDQVIYLNPTELMTIERALAISGGRRLVIVANLPEAPVLPK